MTKESSSHKCIVCEKVFKAAANLDKHMDDKHTESECHMCNKTFTSRKEAENHICLDGDIVAQKCEKSHCNKEFVSSAALKKHMKGSHFGNQRKVCTKCGEILSTNTTDKKHNELCGKSADRGDKSKEVCRHWRKSRCDRGSLCNFSHVGQQYAPRHENKATRNTYQCRNGPSCSFLARGKCHFEHPKENQHQAREQEVRRQNKSRNQPKQGRRQQSDRLPCKLELTVTG